MRNYITYARTLIRTQACTYLLKWSPNSVVSSPYWKCTVNRLLVGCGRHAFGPFDRNTIMQKWYHALGERDAIFHIANGKPNGSIIERKVIFSKIFTRYIVYAACTLYYTHFIVAHILAFVCNICRQNLIFTINGH